MQLSLLAVNLLAVKIACIHRHIISLDFPVSGDELQPALLLAWSETGRTRAQLLVHEHRGSLSHFSIGKENKKAGSSILV